LLFAAHERFGHDLLVTTDSDLLQLSASTDNANILRPSLALPLVHLYLRSRGTFIYDAGERSQSTFNRGLFYLVLLRSLLPELWPFLKAAENLNRALGRLGGAIRIRCIRALQAQDELGRLFFGQRDSSDDRDRMAYHFEYAMLLLQGAIDAQARIVKQTYGVLPSSKASFKNADFRTRLRAKGAGALCDLVETDVQQDLLAALGTIRNKIHDDPLGDLGYSSPATGHVGLLALGGEDAQKVLKSLRNLGDPGAMGVFPFDHPRLLIEPFRCASFFVRHALKFIGAVARASDLGLTPAYEPGQPMAADLFRPRTLNNMRLFSRSVAEL
jgi:hypothetical protein